MSLPDTALCFSLCYCCLILLGGRSLPLLRSHKVGVGLLETASQRGFHLIMIMMKTVITLVKLQSVSRSQGRTRFSEAEADSPVSWANELPRSRSSPDIILWLYSPDITHILWLYCNPVSGPSGAPMATWQHGCLKQGSMVVTGAHKAAPTPCVLERHQCTGASGSCAVASHRAPHHALMASPGPQRAQQGPLP